MKRFAFLALLAASPVAGQEAISCILRPADELEIAPPVAGLLEEMSVDRGDRVEAGQVLGRIESRVQEAQLAAARHRSESMAAILARQAQLADAERRLAQLQSLSDRGVASQNQLNEVLAETEVARAQLAEAEDAQFASRIEVEAAEAALALRTIVAPVSGRVLARHVDPGEYAAADEPMLEIVNVSTLYAEALLPAAAYGEVARGDAVTVVDADRDTSRAGEVTAVDPVIDAASRSFGLRVRIDNADGAFTAGTRCLLGFEQG
ncbi:efflux RND transporter periplasmic adaptor subunit [Mesobacterium pallidum]|uniref:efflux RND transporter periplasmic adaptor subunit n=1 Tax=Mesobacterium pallidum TaxID=2872037 RepID=UPI001EE28F3D|nr:efflux RND transporter periplasmic adaptor subunit [Mesobacterium pallidum]